MSEKNLPPSEKKLREAREKGQVAKSRLFSSAAVTAGALVPTLSFAESTAARLEQWTTTLFSTHQTLPLDALEESVHVLAWCAAPTLIGALLGALVSSVAMAGFHIHFALLLPKFERLDATQGIKKLFSMRQVIDVFKNAAVAAVVIWLLWDAAHDAARASFGASSFLRQLQLLKPALVRATVALVAMGAADWAWARRRRTKDLMMSRDDAKQEHKNSEGDPHHKAKRKSLHRQLSSGGSARGVKQATAVVVNPTHIAVALRYDESECEAPYIVARAQGDEALQLRLQANLHRIPILKDIPLARSLIQCEVGEEIPEELYLAAAALLKVAFDMSAQPAAPQSTL